MKEKHGSDLQKYLITICSKHIRVTGSDTMYIAAIILGNNYKIPVKLSAASERRQRPACNTSADSVVK
jgi:hypothetical protein